MLPITDSRTLIRLFEEDLDWLMKQERSLERDHIEILLRRIVAEEAARRLPEESLVDAKYGRCKLCGAFASEHQKVVNTQDPKWCTFQCPNRLNCRVSAGAFDAIPPGSLLVGQYIAEVVEQVDTAELVEDSPSGIEAVPMCERSPTCVLCTQVGDACYLKEPDVYDVRARQEFWAARGGVLRSYVDWSKVAKRPTLSPEEVGCNFRL